MTSTFLTINVAMFVASHDLVTVLRLLPELRFSANTLDAAALWRFSTFAPFIAENGEWWRIFTSVVFHESLLHLALNCAFLLLFGRRLELLLNRRYKRGVAAVVLGLGYVAMAAGSVAGGMLLIIDRPAIGLSGVAYGAMACVLVIELMARRNPLRSEGWWPLIWMFTLGSLGYQLVTALLSDVPDRVSHGGHLGGLLVGGAIGLLVGWCARSRSTRPLVMSLAAVTVVATAAAVGVSHTWPDGLL